MLAILDLIDAILDWKKFSTAKRSSRKVRQIRRTARGFVVNYYR
jgi:hypothetical protein